MLSGATHLRLSVSGHCGQLRFELLGVGQHAERIARAFQTGDQPRGHSAQRRARQADRTVPPTLLCALAAVELAGGGSPAALAERTLRIVLGHVAVPRRAPGALRRGRDGLLAQRPRSSCRWQRVGGPLHLLNPRTSCAGADPYNPTGRSDRRPYRLGQPWLECRLERAGAVRARAASGHRHDPLGAAVEAQPRLDVERIDRNGDERPEPRPAATRYEVWLRCAASISTAA